jgi:hypothetical protein
MEKNKSLKWTFPHWRKSEVDRGKAAQLQLQLSPIIRGRLINKLPQSERENINLITLLAMGT